MIKSERSDYEGMLAAERAAHRARAHADEMIHENDNDAAAWWAEHAAKHERSIRSHFDAIRAERNRSASVVADDGQLAHLRDVELPLSIGAELHLAQVAAREYVLPHILAAARCAEKDSDMAKWWELTLIANVVDGRHDKMIVNVLRAVLAFVEGGE